MRRLSVSVVGMVLATIMAATLGPAVIHPRPAAAAASFTVSPSSGPIGTSVTVNGSGLKSGTNMEVSFGCTNSSGGGISTYKGFVQVTAGGTAQFTFGGIDAADLQVQNSGCPFSVNVQGIAADVTLANFKQPFTITGSIATATSTPTATPTATATTVTLACAGQAPSFPGILMPGQSATFFASGFAPGRGVTINVTGPSPLSAPAATADAACQVSARIQIGSSDRPGAYTITATGTNPAGGPQTATLSFNMVGPTATATQVTTRPGGSTTTNPPAVNQPTAPGGQPPSSGQTGQTGGSDGPPASSTTTDTSTSTDVPPTAAAGGPSIPTGDTPPDDSLPPDADREAYNRCLTAFIARFGESPDPSRAQAAARACLPFAHSSNVPPENIDDLRWWPFQSQAACVGAYAHHTTFEFDSIWAQCEQQLGRPSSLLDESPPDLDEALYDRCEDALVEWSEWRNLAGGINRLGMFMCYGFAAPSMDRHLTADQARDVFAELISGSGIDLDRCLAFGFAKLKDPWADPSYITRLCLLAGIEED